MFRATFCHWFYWWGKVLLSEFRKSRRQTKTLKCNLALTMLLLREDLFYCLETFKFYSPGNKQALRFWFRVHTHRVCTGMKLEEITTVAGPEHEVHSIKNGIGRIWQRKEGNREPQALTIWKCHYWFLSERIILTR